jgi:hypothetical protein
MTPVRPAIVTFPLLILGAGHLAAGGLEGQPAGLRRGDSNAGAQLRSASPEAVGAAVRAALRIESPEVHSSASCVACHLSTQARLWVERSLG